jgi:hypothetical protein
MPAGLTLKRTKIENDHKNKKLMEKETGGLDVSVAGGLHDAPLLKCS